MRVVAGNKHACRRYNNLKRLLLSYNDITIFRMSNYRINLVSGLYPGMIKELQCKRTVIVGGVMAAALHNFNFSSKLFNIETRVTDGNKTDDNQK